MKIQKNGCLILCDADDKHNIVCSRGRYTATVFGEFFTGDFYHTFWEKLTNRTVERRLNTSYFVFTRLKSISFEYCHFYTLTIVCTYEKRLYVDQFIVVNPTTEHGIWICHPWRFTTNCDITASRHSCDAILTRKKRPFNRIQSSCCVIVEKLKKKARLHWTDSFLFDDALDSKHFSYLVNFSRPYNS